MNLNIQIFGTLKCKDTGKALRFFKERGIKVHFVDLSEKGITPGELDNIARNHSIANLVDTDSKEYKKLNLQYMVYNEKDIILEHPLVLLTPIVRNGRLSTIGMEPEVWKKWIEDAKPK
jgi:arsenate reductase-like glutaredoxin family protein